MDVAGVSTEPRAPKVRPPARFTADFGQITQACGSLAVWSSAAAQGKRSARDTTGLRTCLASAKRRPYRAMHVTWRRGLRGEKASHSSHQYHEVPGHWCSRSPSGLAARREFPARAGVSQSWVAVDGLYAQHPSRSATRGAKPIVHEACPHKLLHFYPSILACANAIQARARTHKRRCVQVHPCPL